MFIATSSCELLHGYTRASRGTLHQRNAVFVGDTETGKAHLAIDIGRC
jgi:hypothetical protein